jgi:hypothetical protein
MQFAQIILILTFFFAPNFIYIYIYIILDADVKNKI